MLKTLGLSALAFVVLLLASPKANAATYTGRLITNYGHPAVITSDCTVTDLNVAITDYTLLQYVGWDLEAQGTLHDDGTVAVNFIRVGSLAPLYDMRQATGGSPEETTTTTILTKLDSVQGQLTYNLFDHPVLTRVLPELYYGSYDQLRLPLIGVDYEKISPYTERTIAVDGKIDYVDGAPVMTPERITHEGAEVTFR